MFDVLPLVAVTDARSGSRHGQGLPDDPPLIGADGRYFGHEWARWLHDTLDARLDRALLDRYPAGAAILDLGCASGARAAQFARAGHRVTAVDILDQAEAIRDRNAALAQETGLVAPIRFIRADIRDLRLEEFGEAFDVVHGRRVLSFVPADALPDALDRIGHLVKPGGLLVASFLSRDVTAADMLADVPHETVPTPVLHPGLFGHRFGAIRHRVEERGFTLSAAFTDGLVDVGFIASLEIRYSP